MTTFEGKYDSVHPFCQGVAIVVKNGKYGAVLMGGKEIIAPTFDYITSFNDGHAEAIRNGRCILLDLSGQECQLYEGKLIAIPGKYDHVRAFKNGFACVEYRGKWGVIDTDGKEVFEPQFDYVSDFCGGTAKYKDRHEGKWGVINSSGFRSDCVFQDLKIEPEGTLIATRQEITTKSISYAETITVRINNQGRLLVDGEKGKVVMPENCYQARSFSEGLVCAQDSKGYWGVVDKAGRVIVPFEYLSIQDYREKKTFGINRDNKLCLLSSFGTVIKVFDKYYGAEPYQNGTAVVHFRWKEGLIDALGNDLLEPVDYTIHHTEKKDEFILSRGSLVGRFYASSGLLVKPRFQDIVQVVADKDYIDVEVRDFGKSRVDLAGRAFIDGDPRIYLPDWCLGVRRLSDDLYAGISDNGLWGFVSGTGKSICTPIYVTIGERQGDILQIETHERIEERRNQPAKTVSRFGLYNIVDHVTIPAEFDTFPEMDNHFYKVCKGGLFGLIDEKGETVLKPQFDEIHVLRAGLFKARKNGKWFLYNQGGALSNGYDTMEFIENETISVSKDGHGGHISLDGKRVILTEEGSFMALPSSVSWGEDFQNGVAKVWIRGFLNYLDRDGSIIIYDDGKIVHPEIEVDYLVGQDLNRNYTFVLDGKYGLLSEAGRVLAEARYDSLTIVENHFYIAAVSFKRYGVLDSTGKVCIDPVYEDIVAFRNGFYVKQAGKWGCFSGDLSVVVEPHYKSLEPLDDGYAKVSIDNPETFHVDPKERVLFGILDPLGHEKLAPEYWFIGDVRDNTLRKGRAFIKRGDKIGIIDENYDILAEPKYCLSSDFIDGKAQVKIEMSSPEIGMFYVSGVLDMDGNFTDLSEIPTDPGSRILSSLKNGNRVVMKDLPYPINRVCAVVDQENHVVLPYRYQQIDELEGGLYRVGLHTSQGTRYGLLNSDYQEIIAPTYCKIEQIQDVFAVSDNPALSIPCVGLMDSSGKTLIPCKYRMITDTTHPGWVWLHQSGNLISLATTKGSVLFERQYFQVKAFVDGFAQVQGVSGEWGIIDEEGREIIPTHYQSITIEDGGGFSVTKMLHVNGETVMVHGNLDREGHHLIKDTEGKLVRASTKYDWQEDYDSTSHSVVYLNGKQGIADDRFRLVILLEKYDETRPLAIPEQYDWAYHQTGDEFIVVEADSKRGIIDLQGKPLVECNYDSIEYVSEKHAGFFLCSILEKTDHPYMTRKKWDLFNTDGIRLLPSPCAEVIQLGYSLMAIKAEDGTCSILDYSGKKTTEDSFDHVLPFGVLSSKNPISLRDDEKPPYAIVVAAGRFGVIDKNGLLVIKPEHTSLEIKENHLFVIDGVLTNLQGLRVVTNGDRTVLLPEEYQTGSLLDNGLILVSKDKLFGCVNQIGQIIIPLEYRSLEYKNGLLVAELQDDPDRFFYKTGVIDFKNNPVVPFGKSIREIKKERGFILVNMDDLWGAFTQQGDLICEAKYDRIEPLSDNLLMIGIRKPYNDYSYDWGLMDRSGHMILEPDYNQYFDDSFADGIIRYGSCGLMGLLDPMGNILLKPEYDRIDAFTDGFAVVTSLRWPYDSEDDERRYYYGVIDSSLKEIIPCVFEDLEFDHTLGRFKTEKGYLSQNGEFVAEYDGRELLIDNRFAFCKPFKDNRAIAVRVANHAYRYGLIDSESHDILPSVFEYLRLLDNGLYQFKLDGLYGLADAEGNILRPNRYNSMGKFTDNLAVVKINNEEEDSVLYGYIDSNGNEVLPTVYPWIGKRQGDYSTVMADGVWGLFSLKDHTIVYFPDVSYLGPCSEGICSINMGGSFDPKEKRVKGGLWGYASSDGQIRIQPRFNTVRGFSEGVAAVKLDEKWGFINVNGETVVPCEYDEVDSNFENGSGRLIKDDEVYVFDENGEIIDSYAFERDEDDDEPVYDYDDTPSIFDNPYYNDNLDMDQQSIEFWNSL